MNVVIEHEVVISTHGEKARPVPADLIQEHGGRQWLKLRPTNYGQHQAFVSEASLVQFQG